MNFAHDRFLPFWGIASSKNARFECLLCQCGCMNRKIELKTRRIATAPRKIDGRFGLAKGKQRVVLYGGARDEGLQEPVHTLLDQ